MQNGVLPKEGKQSFVVTFENIEGSELPVYITQNEFMRRMKEMSANGQNPMMSFYGEMPDSYNFVVNAAHPLVAKILSEEEAECAAKVKPIVDEIAALEAKRKDLKGDKKDEDLAQAIKDEIKDIDAKLAKNGEAKSDVFEAFAKSNKTVQQLVDLALLSNNLLKGEALSDFVKRSVAML